MSTYKDMRGWDNIFTGKYVSTTMHHMPRTGTNLSHRKLQKQKVQQFYVISLFIQTTIQANKPDIAIKDHKEKTRKLIDFTFLMVVNISNK